MNKRNAELIRIIGNITTTFWEPWENWGTVYFQRESALCSFLDAITEVSPAADITWQAVLISDIVTEMSRDARREGKTQPAVVSWDAKSQKLLFNPEELPAAPSLKIQIRGPWEAAC